MRSVCLLSLLSVSFVLPAAAAESLPFEPSEYAARRALVMDQIADGIAIVRNSVRESRNHDFTYLCGVEIPRAVLIVDGVRKQSILFYTTSEHYLKGESLSLELLNHPKSATGVEKCYPADRFSAVLTELAGKTRVIYTPFRTETREPEISTRSEWDGRLTRSMQFVKILRQRFPSAASSPRASERSTRRVSISARAVWLAIGRGLPATRSAGRFARCSTRRDTI